MMTISVRIYKAADGPDESPAANIQITKEQPPFKRERLDEMDAQWTADAEALEDAFYRSLPGGTYDRLLGLMLRRKASHFRVSFYDSLNHGTRIAELERQVGEMSKEAVQ